MLTKVGGESAPASLVSWTEGYDCSGSRLNPIRLQRCMSRKKPHFAQQVIPHEQEDWKSDDEDGQLDTNDRQDLLQLAIAGSPGRVGKREIEVGEQRP